MKTGQFITFLGLFAALSVAAFGQNVVVMDPTKNSPEVSLTAAEEKILKNEAVPRVKKKLGEEGCVAEPEPAGVAHGSFTKAGAKQSIIFYQYCQTGNGLGWAGLVLIENGKMTGNWAADSGWTQEIATVPDINKNGLDEFVLSWGGGMHQGEGGIGVDLMEFKGSLPKGLGWFQAEQFDDTETTNVWKVTAKPGLEPVFYRQKFISAENKKYRHVGSNTVFKLKKTFLSAFEVIK